jgi:hypothetical protein
MRKIVPKPRPLGRETGVLTTAQRRTMIRNLTKTVSKLWTKFPSAHPLFSPTLGTRLSMGLSCSELVQKWSCGTWNDSLDRGSICCRASAVTRKYDAHKHIAIGELCTDVCIISTFQVLPAECKVTITGNISLEYLAWRRQRWESKEHIKSMTCLRPFHDLFMLFIPCIYLQLIH